MAQTAAEYCKDLHRLADELAGRSIRVMEVCGTHTMSIARSGLRQMLPHALELISGPGCPVCVTDQSYMDQAVYLARTPVGGAPPPIVATFGDMVRVPGSNGSLAEARAAGADVEVVASADAAVELARRKPDRQVVMLAVGFETTAPGTALAVIRARDEAVGNFSVLTAHKLILPVMRALLAAGDVRIDGFLCPGHVSVIIGWSAYDEIAREYARPCVVAGFDPVQILAGLVEILSQIAAGRAEAGTVYPTVSPEGNRAALSLLEEVFVRCDAPWRAIGTVPDSALALRDDFAEFDAAKRFDLPSMPAGEAPGCRCGDVICGRCRPTECPLFAVRCTPRDPVGPCMVSSEGACAAAYKYERR